MNMNCQSLIIQNARKKTSDKAFLLFFTMLLLSDAFFGLFFNTDIFTVAIWIIFCFSLFLFRMGFFIKYIVFLFYNTTNILGVYIIENSTIYLEELGVYSYRVNSLFLITLTHCFFIIVLLLLDSKIQNKVFSRGKFARFRIGTVKIDNGIILILTILFIFLSIFLLSKAIINPASRQRMDRFIYQNTYISGMWSILHTYLIYLIPILVIISLKRKFFLSAIGLFVFCFYMYLVGHKFGVYFTVLVFFIPYIIERFGFDRISFKNLNKVFIIGIIVIMCLLAILYSFMNKTYGSDKQQFVDYLFNRLAQQGQMWWAIYGKEKGIGYHFDELSVSAGALFGINKEVIKNYDFGIYKLMKLVTPYSIYYAKIYNNSRYAFSTQASLFYYFKSIGLIGISGLMAVFFSYIVNWYWREVEHSSWFGSIVSGFFYILILSVYTQSDFNVLLSKPKALLVILYFVVRKLCLLISSKKKLANDR